MRITAVHERTIPLQGGIANAVVDFSRHTVSLVVLVSDTVRNGRPLCGVAFNSIGRFAQGGILRERLVPRLLETQPERLLNRDGTAFDPAAVARAVMRDEKPGGHGDRAGAVAALELAAWDLNAKIADAPAYEYMASSLGHAPRRDGTPVYAAGGYYYPDDSITRLRDELGGYRDRGYEAFKIKIGGAPLAEDLRRIDAAIDIAGAADRVAVDANGRFDRADAMAWGDALQERGLRWYEEPVDPLDYGLLAELAGRYPGSLATGENLFSAIDTKNLITWGGLRPDRDILQMDPGLAYGLTGYLQMLGHAEAAGFARSRCLPHGGHLINLHIVTALGLGGCEAYPNVFQPFGGWSPQCVVRDGRVWPGDAPGFGLEQKPELAAHIAALVES